MTEIELLRKYFDAHQKMSAAIHAEQFAIAAAEANAARDNLIAMRISKSKEKQMELLA